MASVVKFTSASVSVHLRHIERKIANPSNQDIAPELSCKNYDLLHHEQHYKYYKERLAELHYLHRADVKTMAGWVITAPKSLPESELINFFRLTTDFLLARYGPENGVAAIVHMDEARPHLHYYFLPVVQDKKNGGEKICCKEVLNRVELQRFHSDYKKYLNDHNCYADVNTGITREQGGNRTVKELKAARTIEQDIWRSQVIDKEQEEEFSW